ncbi:unnamed protein product, partial [Ranitomeya imitator]
MQARSKGSEIRMDRKQWVSKAYQVGIICSSHKHTLQERQSRWTAAYQIQVISVTIVGFSIIKRGVPTILTKCVIQKRTDKDTGSGFEHGYSVPRLTMVISKETRAAIIALHKNGLTGKSIAATKIAPQSTIYRIIKNFKERASIVVKKTPGRPRKTSKRQDRILTLFQLRDRTTSSAELAQEWQQA